MQQRSEETHTIIKETAQRLFARSGYDATGVAEICSEAGVSKGAFYFHFPSKQAVFLEITNDWMNNLEESFNLIIESAQDFPQALLQMAEIVGTAFQSMDLRYTIFLEFWGQARRDPVIWDAVTAPYQRYQAYFARLIQQGIQQGTLRPVDPDKAARTLISLAIGLLMQAMFDPQATNWVHETRQSIRMLLDGMIRRTT
jgi:AcrR family transcriptional regulator